MASPSIISAEGSSQSTDGILHGKAIVNFADMQDIAAAKPIDTSVKGTVKVYTLNIEPSELDCATMKPITKVTIKINTNIGPVLAEVANQYPAIKCKSICMIFQLLLYFFLRKCYLCIYDPSDGL